MLPERAINNIGRVIYSKEKTDWVELGAKKKSIERVFHDLKLNIDNSITGKRMASFIDYGAYEKRKELESYNSDDDYLENFETEFNGLTITGFEMKNKDDIYSKLIESWDIKLKKHVEKIDDLLMINLNFIDQVKENQFKLDQRTYPVNYPYCFSKSNTVRIELPEGYLVNEIPKPVRFALPNKGGSFFISYSKQGNIIVMNCKMEINKEVFLPNEYPYLKEFFAQIIKKQAEPIILKKI